MTKQPDNQDEANVAANIVAELILEKRDRDAAIAFTQLLCCKKRKVTLKVLQESEMAVNAEIEKCAGKNSGFRMGHYSWTSDVPNRSGPGFYCQVYTIDVYLPGEDEDSCYRILLGSSGPFFHEPTQQDLENAEIANDSLT
jgi:hypothetical protein